METTAIARYARIAPRKARMIVNLVRGQNVAQALDVLTYTRKSGAPIVKKLIESAMANAKSQGNVNIDRLWIGAGAVDKGPNKHLRRWRPRAMGRATQIVKGVSHIQITLTDQPPKAKPGKERPSKAEKDAPVSASGAAAAAPTGETTTVTESSESKS